MEVHNKDSGSAGCASSVRGVGRNTDRGREVRHAVARWSALLFLVCHVALAGSGKIGVVGSDTVDFGKYPASEKKVARYTLKNTGDDLLTIIKVRKTCGCAKAEASRKELNPGETSIVEVTILANSIFNAYNKKTYIESSDPRKRFLSLTVKGNAIPLVDILPKSHVNAGRLSLNETWKHSFDLKARFEGVRLGEPVIESTYPVTTQFVPVPGSNAHYRLDAELLPATKPGPWTCKIRVPVLSPANQKAPEITIAGKIGSELLAIPSVIRLQKSPEPVARRFRLKLLSPGADRLDPKLIEWPEFGGVAFWAEPAAASESLWIALQISPDFVAQSLKAGEKKLSVGYPSAVPAKLTIRVK